MCETTFSALRLSFSADLLCNESGGCSVLMELLCTLVLMLRCFQVHSSVNFVAFKRCAQCTPTTLMCTLWMFSEVSTRTTLVCIWGQHSPAGASPPPPPFNYQVPHPTAHLSPNTFTNLQNGARTQCFFPD